MNAGPGQIYAWHIANQDAADTWLHVYDALAANVTVGTTTPKWTFWVPASSGVDGGCAPGDDDAGAISCATGISVAATTTIGGLTAPTTGLLVNLVYA